MLCRWRPVALVDMGREGSAWEKGYEGWCSGWSCRFSVTQISCMCPFPCFRSRGGADDVGIWESCCLFTLRRRGLLSKNHIHVKRSHFLHKQTVE